MKLPTIPLTDEQSEWIADQKKNRVESFATIIRGLIQEKVEKEKRK